MSTNLNGYSDFNATGMEKNKEEEEEMITTGWQGVW